MGWLAVVTMIVGVLGAVYHYDIRRILAFHSVSQMGYILLAVALGGTAAMAAAVFFIIHHVLVKSNLYLIAGMMARNGSFDLRSLGGLYGGQPALALLFGITAASLVGFPPLSGFWAKLLVLREGFAQAEYVWAAATLATGGLTLLSMAKIWTEAFWKPQPVSHPTVALHGDSEVGNSHSQPPRCEKKRYPQAMWLASGVLAALALALGLLPGLWLSFLEQAVEAAEFAPTGVLS
jgi:multicomponent Na+:H+ antiporter subunit D